MDYGFTFAAYAVAAVLFILSLGGLSGQESAKRAVWYGIVGMAIAVGATLLGPGSGLWLASLWLPHALWLGNSPQATLIQAKLGLLALTAALGVHARLVLIPRLTAERLPVLGWHITLITLSALAFAWVGSGFRFGGLL